MGINLNLKQPKPIKKEHLIEEYISKQDYVRCKCGFETKSDGFHQHMKDATGKYPHAATLSTLGEISKARSDYPTNGTLKSFRGKLD